jgi:Uma2 family endonuclease
MTPSLLERFPPQSELPRQGQWTYADYCRLPEDGWRYEVIRGVLYMTPAPWPRHRKATGNILAALHRHVQEGDLGEVYAAPIDVLLPGLTDPVQPDILFLARDRLDIVKEKAIEGVPDLIVEVLSPTNWFTDQRIKFEVYATAGVKEYWIVDSDRKTVEVYGLKDGAYALAG